MKKNLILLRVLDFQGYKYSVEDGVLKVSKGALVVFKGKLVNGLYLLQRSTDTVIGATVLPFSSNSNLDTILLYMAYVLGVYE